MNPEGNEKHVQEGTIQTITHKLTSESNIQPIQNVIQSNIHNVSTITPQTQFMGKPVLMDPSHKITIRKPFIPATVDSSKITATISPLGPIGPPVRLIQPSAMQPAPIPQQIVTSIPTPTYHVPRGPAAVANISAPRSAMATPIRSSTSHSVQVPRSSVNSTAPNSQWQPKTSPIYTQPRYPIPTVNRGMTRPPTPVYPGPPRLVSPAPGRLQQSSTTTVLAGVSIPPSKLGTPVLPSTTNMPRLTLTSTKTTVVPQATNIPQNAQSGRIPTIQQTQASKPPNSITFSTNRVAPVINATNKIVAVQPAAGGPVGRQLPINVVPGAPTTNLSRIVLTPTQVQPQPPVTGRVMQTVPSIPNFTTVSRPVTTTPAIATTTARIPQHNTGLAAVSRIPSVPQHQPMPPTARNLLTALKVVHTQIQIKPPAAQQVQQVQQQVAPKTTVASVVTSSIATVPQPMSGQYLQTHLFDTQGPYQSFKPTPVQPVRFLVEPNFEESHKTNSSPRPSILRKPPDVTSPAKAAAVKNLTPALACLATTSSPTTHPGSPPGSPGGDQDGGGCQSSGSTTVSATSSPGLDEPEQSRIPMNPNIEMSPRKKPRKQQLTEFTESRGTDEEMQFIVDERIKKEKPEERDRKFGAHEKKENSVAGQQSDSTPIQSKPMPYLVGSSWRTLLPSDSLRHYQRPTDVRPREEKKPTVAEIAQQECVLQKLNGWKIYHLTSQMDDLAEVEQQVHEKLKSILTMLESQQTVKSRQDDDLERVNELIKGNMQRSDVISEGMTEAKTHLTAIFQHKNPVCDILQRCGNKRAPKKREK